MLSAREAYKRFKAAGVFDADAIDIISHLLKTPFNDVKGRLGELPDIPKELVDNVLTALYAQIPVAYITGRKEFYGREFAVTTDTLIPRADTETLIEAVLTHSKPKRVLDLCTGAGCILLTLLAETDAGFGLGVDISAKALAVAKQNAETVVPSKTVNFLSLDVLNADLAKLILDNSIDTITINPPYIPEHEYLSLDKSISFEPRQALVADDDGLIFYKKLLYYIDKLSTMCRTEKNALSFYMEIGYNQGTAISDIARGFGLDIVIEQDLGGRDRVARVYL